MAIKLDKSRDYATVHGEHELPVAFVQDGLHFNHHGDLIEAMVTTDAHRALVAKKMRRIEKLAAQSADKPPSDQPPAPPADDDDDDLDDDKDAGDGVNLEQWLRDEVRYPPATIFKTMRERYSKQCSTFKEVAEFLVYDEQIVGPDEVPTKLKAA